MSKWRFCWIVIMKWACLLLSFVLLPSLFFHWISLTNKNVVHFISTKYWRLVSSLIEQTVFKFSYYYFLSSFVAPSNDSELVMIMKQLACWLRLSDVINYRNYRDKKQRYNSSLSRHVNPLANACVTHDVKLGLPVLFKQGYNTKRKTKQHKL